MKNVLCVMALAMVTLAACTSVAPAATAMLTSTIAPTETITPTSAAVPLATAIPELVSVTQLDGLNSQYALNAGRLTYTDEANKAYTVFTEKGTNITIQTDSGPKDIDPSLYKTFVPAGKYEGGGIPVIMNDQDPTKVDLLYIAGLGDSGEFVAPIEISTDENNPVQITQDDVYSGRFALSEALVATPFPSSAKMSGWFEQEASGANNKACDISSYPDYHNNVDSRPEKLFSVSKVDLNFPGIQVTKYAVLGVQVLNTDGTYSFLHFALDAKYLTMVLQKVGYVQNDYVGFFTHYPTAAPGFEYMTAMLNSQSDIPGLAQIMENGGVIPSALEKKLLPPDARSW